MRDGHHQRGVALIELLVGLTIGLLVIAAALGTLLLSRGASTTISDISKLQQQGSYALRVIGTQFRQAGSVETIQTPSGLFSFNNDFVGFNGGSTVVVGSEGAGGASDQVSVSNQPSTLATQRRDCVAKDITTGVRMDSTFYVKDNVLYCRGFNAIAEPVIANVADFQVRYRIKTIAGTRDLRSDEIAAAGLWPSVKAIEICLDLQGNDGSHPNSGTYQSCQPGSLSGFASASRDGRIHVVFRNVFDLRTQGL